MAQSGDVYRLIGSLLTTCISIAMASGVMPGNALFSAAISGWLWVTVLFANFAEALAEGRSKAQANSLKGVKNRFCSQTARTEIWRCGGQSSC